MKRMRVFCMGLACASLLTFMNVNVGAAVYDGQLQPETELHMVVARASGQFSTTIKANAKMKASSTFPLAPVRPCASTPATRPPEALTLV